MASTSSKLILRAILGTREWTKVPTQSATPVGRYGHAVTMVGSKFYMFAGQVDGEFMNDLWMFDLNTCTFRDYKILTGLSSDVVCSAIQSCLGAYRTRRGLA